MEQPNDVPRLPQPNRLYDQSHVHADGRSHLCAREDRHQGVQRQQVHLSRRYEEQLAVDRLPTAEIEITF